MTSLLRVALLGFSTFERGALGAFFDLFAQRNPAYKVVREGEPAQLLLVAMESPFAVEQVEREGLGERTVFVGGTFPPPDAVAWLARPFDPHWLLRELDVLAAMQAPPAATRPAPPPPAAAPEPPATISGLPALDPDTELPTLTAALDEAEPTPAPRPAARPRSGVPMALIVDDSDVALRFLEGKLQGLGLQVELARDSRTASSQLARQAYDVVFVDVELGPASDVDGLVLCQQIRRGPLHLAELPPRVVVVTAHASPLMRVRADLAGADAFLPKPLSDEALRATLRGLGLVGFRN